MALTGIAMGVAGRTAPLSGTEHLASHLLDMRAAAGGSDTALHGAQVGVASIVAATIWHDTLDCFDPTVLERSGIADDPATIERLVRDAFDPLDPSGSMAEECWRDVRRKVERWSSMRSSIHAFIADWDRHRTALKQLVVPPDRLRNALVGAGAPSTVGELDPPAGAEVTRWAIAALPLMRDRFTVADLRFFAGDWDALDMRSFVGPGSRERRHDVHPCRCPSPADAHLRRLRVRSRRNAVPGRSTAAGGGQHGRGASGCRCPDHLLTNKPLETRPPMPQS